ncbi:MAG: hypothetical protein FWD73_13340 [Polyangiaceae bacterium]|nr:hypothetical protein [Polyangiaceae bacterium]
MKHLLIVPSLAFIVAGAACTTERIVIVEKPPASKNDNTEPTYANGEDDTPSTFEPLADESKNDDSEWGLQSPSDRQYYQDYARVIRKVSSMVSDSDLQRRARARALSVVNVMWEDTGRAQHSSLGPNISDLSLQVRRKDERGHYQSSIMPVIRPPNFSDRTGDIPADHFFVRVGNEKGQSLRTVPLTDVLGNLKAFASRPNSIVGDGNVLAARDTHFLVSAQAVFLPIPKSGKAMFNPVLFNYQSAPGSPAVLSILITRQGSSMQVIENKHDDVTAAGWGQELYFNGNGRRSAFTAERKSDVAQRIEAQGGPKSEDDRSALQKGADVLFLVQVPLKHANRGYLGGALPSLDGSSWDDKAPVNKALPSAPAEAAPMARARPSREQSNVEQAVVGHGPNLGPFNEGHGLRLERDPKFPIRVTVQFYKATSNGVASDVDLDSIARSIDSVYRHADVVGSLVVPDGDSLRPTSWQKVPQEWFPW